MGQQPERSRPPSPALRGFVITMKTMMVQSCSPLIFFQKGALDFQIGAHVCFATSTAVNCLLRPLLPWPDSHSALLIYQQVQFEVVASEDRRLLLLLFRNSQRRLDQARFRSCEMEFPVLRSLWHTGFNAERPHQPLASRFSSMSTTTSSRVAVPVLVARLCDSNHTLWV